MSKTRKARNPAGLGIGNPSEEYSDPNNGADAVSIVGVFPGVVIPVGPPPVYTSVSSAQISGGLVADQVLKAAAGTHYTTHVMLDASAPAGTYYVQFLQCALGGAVPPDGAVTHLHGPRTIEAVGGQPYEVVFDDLDGGIPIPADGVCVVLSSTQFLKTLSGAYLTVDAAVL